ncbi:MAG: hypothetical protein E4H40_02855 [Candidatus Brocadiia bacterium]|nr:MAG: hypothetical protein E4H40_02855 [Candidatus Brocadiia bacterium]
MEKIKKLTNILLRLNEGSEVNSFDYDDRKFLADLSSRDIAIAQQNVLSSGVPASDLWRIWDRNRSILPDQAAKLRTELPDNHVLQKALAEHAMLLCFIADLNDVTSRIKMMTYASSTNSEIRKLAHIAEHLVKTEQHCEREDYIIFPELKRRGYRQLLNIVNEQHRQIVERQRSLKELVWMVDRTDFTDFRTQLTDVSDYLVIAVRLHIFIENNIVFPLALEVISEKNIWEKMKDICDEIGYCGCNCS